VEAAVLDGGGGVIMNEGPGLGETERTVMVVGGESWTRLDSRASGHGRVKACPKHTETIRHVLLFFATR
jgi:hypothetical protein